MREIYLDWFTLMSTVFVALSGVTFFLKSSSRILNLWEVLIAFDNDYAGFYHDIIKILANKQIELGPNLNLVENMTSFWGFLQSLIWSRA